MEKVHLKDKVSHYIDAGFPVLYVHTYEEEKIDDILLEIAGDKEVYEWNETNGFIDFRTSTFSNRIWKISSFR